MQKDPLDASRSRLVIWYIDTRFAVCIRLLSLYPGTSYHSRIPDATPPPYFSILATRRAVFLGHAKSTEMCPCLPEASVRYCACASTGKALRFPRSNLQLFRCRSERQLEKHRDVSIMDRRRAILATHPKASKSNGHLFGTCKARYVQNQPRIHVTTCRHQPTFPAHRIGSAGTGKGSSAARCCILDDVDGLQPLELDAHSRYPDYADWPAAVGDVCYHRTHFPVRNLP